MSIEGCILSFLDFPHALSCSLISKVPFLSPSPLSSLRTGGAHSKEQHTHAHHQRWRSSGLRSLRTLSLDSLPQQEDSLLHTLHALQSLLSRCAPRSPRHSTRHLSLSRLPRRAPRAPYKAWPKDSATPWRERPPPVRAGPCAR